VDKLLVPGRQKCKRPVIHEPYVKVAAHSNSPPLRLANRIMVPRSNSVSEKLIAIRKDDMPRGPCFGNSEEQNHWIGDESKQA
jgi:hypothetical protein